MTQSFVRSIALPDYAEAQDEDEEGEAYLKEGLR